MRAPAGSPSPQAFRLVWSLAWPTVVHNLLLLTLGVADLLMVRSLGLDATAAIGLARQVTILVEGAVAALSTGVLVQVSQGLGAGDKARVAGAVRQAVLLVAFLGVPTTILGIFLSRPCMMALHAEPRALEHGVSYLQVYFGGLIVLCVPVVSAAIYRGAGDAMTPLTIAAAISLLNVPLNYVFIHGLGHVPAFGVQGAAIGTVGAWGCGAVIYIGLLLRGRSRGGIRLVPTWKPDRGMIRRMLRVGVPSALASLLRNSARLVFLALIGMTSLGLPLQAAVGVAMQIRLLSVMPAIAFQVSTAALVGQALGRNDDTAAEATGTQSTVLLALLMLCVVGPLLAFAHPIAEIFIEDRTVVPLATSVLRWFAVAQFFSALSISVQGALNGAGDTRPAMRYMLITQWGLMLPVVYVSISNPDWIPEGPLIAWLLAPVLSFALTLRRFRGGLWKTLRV